MTWTAKYGEMDSGLFTIVYSDGVNEDEITYSVDPDSFTESTHKEIAAKEIARREKVQGAMDKVSFQVGDDIQIGDA